MASADPANHDAPAYQVRNYQLEMLEVSMKENIIVAMDTGSGKTRIAVLRIQEELDICPPDKLVWFLAPTVALCSQQHNVIVRDLPAVQSRTLTGLDKVELWTDQSIWDAVLKDIRVVVSTHAVLADALSHGFVKMSRLALVIFDEAHHCMRKHPANKIMQDFYHPTLSKLGPSAVPRIMGLTASPVVRSNRQELLTIEANLDAVCKTPRVHRQELLTFTHRPQLKQILYTPPDPADFEGASRTLRALIYAWKTLDIEDDPYVKRLMESPLDGKALQKALMTGKTYCRGQLKRFVDRSWHIFEELGGWAADYYIHESIEQLRSRVQTSYMAGDWDEAEKVFLVDFLSRIPAADIEVALSNPASFRISPKLAALLSFLDAMDNPEFSGLIFVKQRATVSVMTSLLSVHPLTRERFRCAAYVGWSNSSGSKDILGDLLSMHAQLNTLDDFRSGRKNLIIATDVLEEGIDISACRVVVCYDKPPNLKSFVQRRGRARQKKSTYAIMFQTDDAAFDLGKWQDLEQAMIEAYQDDERQLRSAYELESLDEEIMERFTVESTGAVLTADKAMAHLHHFCSVLPSQPYVDTRPVFSFVENGGLLKGTVILPNCVHPRVRRTESEGWWRTERAAMKQAAFQAYKSLYEFGLVNDNLLPLTNKPELKSKDLGSIPSVVKASGQYDPWIDWAHLWSSPDIHQTRIVVRLNEEMDKDLCMRLTGPTVFPVPAPMTLFWDSETTFTLTFEATERLPLVPTSSVEDMRTITALYLQTTSSRLLKSEHDFTTLFGPDLPHTELEAWLRIYGGYDPALEVYSCGRNPVLMGMVRDRSNYNEPFLFRRWLVPGENQTSSVIELECDPFPRRRNLLHRQTLAVKQTNIDDEESAEPGLKLHIVPADQCTIERLPFSNARFGLFISVIVEQLQAELIATRLRDSLLRDVGFTSTRHIITAITAPSAQALTNYQRYEFLGDSILKFSASCQLFFQHPNWHEGYLSEGRDQIVQNPRLTKAALDIGLDAFIITEMFTPRKWSAPLISERLERVSSKREMSSKVLADVVEALIGAAYIDGGHAAAQAFIHRFLPEINLHTLDIRTTTRSVAPKGARRMVNDRLKRLIGYAFEDESLLVEALTHPSCDYSASTQSYQRLEFLGDAVLDMVIVSAIFNHPVQIPQGNMTRVKHAVVNANLLAFFCMEFAMVEERTDVEQISAGQFEKKSSEELIELWRFMRYSGQNLSSARDASLSRHRALRDEINHSLQHDPYYPWQALSQLSADKFFSDIVESVLGAIFVDSGGDLAPCEAFVEAIGLMSYLRRILDEGIDVTHPRNVAQRLAKSKIQFQTQRIPDGEGGASYQSLVRIEDVEVLIVKGRLTAEEAEVTAAIEAIDILMKRANGDPDLGEMSIT